MAVNPSDVVANHKRFSAPVRWFAGIIREAGPWFFFVGTCAALLAVCARHLTEMCKEAESWCATNIDNQKSQRGEASESLGSGSGATPANTNTHSEAA